MNWSGVKEKYPKTWDKLYNSEFDFYFNKDRDRNDSNRFLYDFFDEQGIYINVVRMWYFEDTIENSLHEFFDWEIIVEREFVGDSEVEEPTRTEAEEQAFIKAFEILEDRL